MDCLICKNCLYDASVGGCVECLCEELSEEELEKYWTNGEPGCPYCKKQD